MRLLVSLPALLAVAVLVFMSSACSGRADQESVVWDDDSKICMIPSVGMRVALPADGDWTVACGDSLPGEMVFCALDAEPQILVAAVIPSVTIATDHVAQLDREECRRMVSELTRQQSEAVYGDIELQPVVARCGGLLRFRQVVELAAADTVAALPVVYDGIFGVGNRRPFIVFEMHAAAAAGVMDAIVEGLSAEI